MLILDSVLWGDRICGGKFDAFFNVFFCILGVYLGGFGILGEESPQEIAGNNTDCLFVFKFKTKFDSFCVHTYRLSANLGGAEQDQLHRSLAVRRGGRREQLPDRLSGHSCLRGLRVGSIRGHVLAPHERQQLELEECQQ